MIPNRAQVALAVLLAINMMNFFDRNILGAVGEQIRKEWSLSDTALGTLGTAFTLIYASSACLLPPCRQVRRTRILGVGVFVWSALTAARASVPASRSSSSCGSASASARPRAPRLLVADR